MTDARELAALALRYLDHQDALGQPVGTLDRTLEDAAKAVLRESNAPGRGSNQEPRGAA